MKSQAARGYRPLSDIAFCLGLVALTACKCSGDPGSQTGVARVLAACVGDCGVIGRVTVTVSRGDGPDFSEIVTDLTLSGSQWSGRITSIPVGPNRRFQAVGTNVQGDTVATGAAQHDIEKDEVAVVSIDLYPPSGPDHPPVIDGIAASANPVVPGGQSTVSVAAHDPDPGDVLAYQWTATCGSFASPRAAFTVWTAPQAEGLCSLSVTVSDGRGGTAVAVLTLTISSTGGAAVGTLPNSAPVINRLSGSFVLGSLMTGDLSVGAVDPDGDAVDYAWSTTCPGLTFLLAPPHGPTRPGISFPGPSDTCAVTVTVTDPPARGGRTEGTILLPPNQPLSSCVGVVCKASDLCHLPGSCDPFSGTCGPQSPKICPAGQSCDPLDGVCKAGGLCAGVVCPPIDLCHDPGSCDPASGQCSPGVAKVCQPSDACHDPGTCNLTDGQCSAGPPKSCPPIDLCHDPGSCSLTTGQCSPGAPKVCPGGQSCDLADGQCKPATSVVAIRPQLAKRLLIPRLPGLGMDTAGATYVAGPVLPPPKDFDGIPVSSAGLNDVLVAKYDAAGTILWAKPFGDPSDQTPTQLAVPDLASNRVVVSGRFSGLLTPLNAGAQVWDFVLFLDGVNGAQLGARAIDTGLGGAMFGLGANPGLGLVAICGAADKLAADTTSGAPGTTWATVVGANTFGGASDIVIGLYNASGTLLWAKQIGTAADEQCSAVTVDDQGNVVAAGAYSGSGNLTLAGSTPLPNPGASFRRHIWVAKFDGATGAGLAQRAYGGGAGAQVVNGISVNAAGNVFLAGAFTNSIPFGAATGGGATACSAGTAGCLASAGGQDAYLARLDASLAPVWMTRIGVSTGDDAARGLALDSTGDPSVSGLLSGASTASTITPATTATPPVGSASITAPGAASASFVLKLPAGTGLFNPATAATTGNDASSVGTRIAINAKGTGANRDRVSFGGEFAGGTLDFGSPTTPLTSDEAAAFLVFAKLLP